MSVVSIWSIPGAEKVLGVESMREIWSMPQEQRDRVSAGYDCQFEVARYLKKRKGGVCHKTAYMHGPRGYGWLDAPPATFNGMWLASQHWVSVCFVPETAHGKLQFLASHQMGEVLYRVYRVEVPRVSP